MSTYMIVFHSLMCFVICIVFMIATINKDYGTCLGEPLHVIAFNSLIILLSIISEALVVACLVLMCAVCCPYVTWWNVS